MDDKRKAQEKSYDDYCAALKVRYDMVPTNALTKEDWESERQRKPKIMKEAQAATAAYEANQAAWKAKAYADMVEKYVNNPKSALDFTPEVKASLQLTPLVTPTGPSRSGLVGACSHLTDPPKPLPLPSKGSPRRTQAGRLKTSRPGQMPAVLPKHLQWPPPGLDERLYPGPKKEKKAPEGKK